MQKISDGKTTAPTAPPIVSFDGAEAAEVMARFLHDEDASTVFEELSSMRRSV